MHRFDLGAYTSSSPSCVCIGVFDGVHLGHQILLGKCADDARSYCLKSSCLTFHPHPAELVAPKYAPLYICSLSQRIELIKELGGVDDVVVAPFTFEFSQLSPDAFVKEVLKERMNATRLYVGEDFRYGKDREGDIASLELAGRSFGFTVTRIETIMNGSERISSTDVRRCITLGDFNSAKHLLQRDFAVRGSVVYGKQLGRIIGFPTINLKPESHRQLLPSDGVYAGYTKIADDPRLIRSAISVGTNPTTDNDNVRKIEAYLMDGFNRNVYGQTADISFVEQIREQKEYADIEQLVVQIKRDVDAIKVAIPKSSIDRAH